MLTSAQPSTPNPVASAISGPNSSSAHSRMTSGEARSNSLERALSSSSVVSELIEGVDVVIAHFFLPSCGNRKTLLFQRRTTEAIFKPVETLAHLHHFSDNDDRRRANAKTLCLI